MAGTQRYWVITGWNSTTKIYEAKVKYGCVSEKQMKNLLRALTAKHGLTDSEIVSSYARRNTKIASPSLLDVQVYGKSNMLSCGTNPYFTAQEIACLN